MSKIATYGLADSPLQLSDRLIGTEAPRPQPSVTPLATKNFSLGELLQLFSSNFPAASLQAVLDTGNTATQNITLTGTITSSVIKPEEIEDSAGSQGATFQFLSKASNGINWVDLPIVYPTLDEVLAEGDTSQRFAKVGRIYLFDERFTVYSSISVKNRRFIFTDDLGQQYVNIFQNTISLIDSSSLYSFQIKKPTVLSNNHTAFLQDTSGTIAYLGDIPTPISLTTIGDSGPATLIGSVLNIPEYSGYTFSSPLSESLGVVSISQASTISNGYLSLSDFNTFNDKQDSITLTTIGGSGPSTFIGNVLNIPEYTLASLGGVPYTGATQNVNLGIYSLTANELIIGTSGVLAYSDGFFVNKGESIAYLAKQSDYLSLYIYDVDANFGSNQFIVDTETGLYYDKIDVNNLRGLFSANEYNLTYLITEDNVQINSFVVDNQYAFSEKGFRSDWENGFLSAATNYDGQTREFVFNSGQAYYSLTEQQASIYANGEEGIYLDVVGQDGTDAVNYGLIVSPSNVLFRAERGATQNYLTFDENQCYITKNVITDEGFEGNYLQLNTAAAEANAVGKLKWNDTDGTADLGLKGGNVTLQIGQETVVRVVNKTGSNLLESNYQVVRIRTQAEGGAAGQRLAVKLAQANTKENHSAILGLVTEDINNNQEGFITTFGNVNKINTTGSLQGQTWNDGDDLWLSESVAGGLTNIEPTVHPVRIGYVIYAHSNNGKIYVSLDNGVDELDELHNVDINSPVNNEVLAYNSSNQLWENKTLSEVNAQQFFMNLPYRYINTAKSVGSNASGETQLIRVTIPANSFSSSDKFYFRLGFSKEGALNAATIRAKLTTSASMPSGTTSQIATASIGNTALYAPVERNMAISGGNLKGFAFTSANVSDSATGVNAWGSVAFDVTQTQYFYVSITPASSTTDVTYLEFIEISNI